MDSTQIRPHGLAYPVQRKEYATYNILTTRLTHVNMLNFKTIGNSSHPSNFIHLFTFYLKIHETIYMHWALVLTTKRPFVICI